MPASYIVVRGDLPTRHKVVQACHAGIKAASEGLIGKGIENLVVLEVAGLPALIETSCRLSDEKIRHKVFTEEDMDGQATALATEVLDVDRRKTFANFPLLKG